MMERPGAARSALLAAMVVALAGGAGFGVYRWMAPGAARVPVPSTVAARMSALLPAPAPRVIPERLPAITLSDLSGKPRALATFHEATLVINFWATWCAPCRREIPLLRQLRAERRAGGVEVIGIAVDFRDSVEKYAREMHLDYPLLVGEDDGLAAAEAFGMELALPFTVFADAQRRIVAVQVGELHAEEARFILDTVQQINAKTLDSGLARRLIAAKMQELAIQRARESAATNQG